MSEATQAPVLSSAPAQPPWPLPAAADAKVFDTKANRRSITDQWWSKSARIQSKVQLKSLALVSKLKKEPKSESEPEVAAAASQSSQSSKPRVEEPAAADDKSNHVQFSSPLADALSQHERDFITNVNALVDNHFYALRSGLQEEVANWLELIKQEVQLDHAESS